VVGAGARRHGPRRRFQPLTTIGNPCLGHKSASFFGDPLLPFTPQFDGVVTIPESDSHAVAAQGQQQGIRSQTVDFEKNHIHSETLLTG